MQKRILIILLGAIGDVTRGLSLAQRIKENWPNCHITWAVEPISQDLVAHHPAIDQCIVFQRSGKLPAYLKFIKELRKNKYDFVLDLQRHFKSGITSFLSGSKVRVGFHRKNAKELNWLFNNRHIPQADNFIPKINHYHLFAKYLGLNETEKFNFGFKINEDSLVKVSQLLEDKSNSQNLNLNCASLILGSTWPSRFWVTEKYAELITSLYEIHNITSILLGGKNELSFAEEIANQTPKQYFYNLVGKTSLLDLFAVFKKSRLAIGSDSGPMHIAAAINTPVISLWGSTSPKRSAPYNNEKFLLQSPIGCSPCYKKVCPGLGNLCMRTIPASAVLAHVENILNNEKNKEN